MHLSQKNTITEHKMSNVCTTTSILYTAADRTDHRCLRSIGSLSLKALVADSYIVNGDSRSDRYWFTVRGAADRSGLCIWRRAAYCGWRTRWTDDACWFSIALFSACRVRPDPRFLTRQTYCCCRRRCFSGWVYGLRLYGQYRQYRCCIVFRARRLSRAISPSIWRARIISTYHRLRSSGIDSRHGF